MKNELKIAWIAGIVSLILLIPILILSFVREFSSLSSFLMILYSSLSITDAIASIFFLRGFILIGEKLKNQFLVAISYVMIMIGIIFSIYDLFLLAYPSLEPKALDFIILFLFGIVSIFFGISLLQLKKKFGAIAKATAILEIITGITLATIFLSFIGLILIIPTTILEIIILYRAAKKYK